MGIDEPKGEGISGTARVIRPEFSANRRRHAPQGEPGNVLPFKRKRVHTAVLSGSDPELLLVRLNGSIRYDLLLRGLREAGLVVKQDRDGLIITHRRASLG